MLHQCSQRRLGHWYTNPPTARVILPHDSQTLPPCNQCVVPSTTAADLATTTAAIAPAPFTTIAIAAVATTLASSARSRAP